MVVVVGVLIAVAAIYAPGAAAADITVDDAVASGVNFFAYTGASWTSCGGCNSSASNGSYRYAYTTGDKAILTFTGTQASIYGFKEPAGGIGAFAVDGGPTADIDYYASTQALSTVFTTPLLTNAQHTVTVTVTGRKTSGLSPTINIDKAVITTSSTTPPTTTTTTTTTQSTSGMASITFDDGTIGQYTYARPVMVQRSLRGTFFIISDALGWTGTNMNATQVRQLVIDGDEIGNHTRSHPDLASLTSSQVTAEFSDSQSSIASQIGVTPTTCAYPYGSHTAVVDVIAAEFFRGCRDTAGGLNTMGSLQPYSLHNFYVVQTTTADDVRSAALQAEAQGSWVIFTYHGVNPSGSGSEDVTPAHLAEQSDALGSTNIPVVTVSQGLAVYGR